MNNSAMVFICWLPIILSIIVIIIVFAVIKRNNNKLDLNKLEEYRYKYDQWLKSGFNLKKLDSDLQEELTLDEKIKIYKEFETNINKLKDLYEEINKIDINFSNGANKELLDLLKQPDKVAQIEGLIIKIKDKKINDTKGQRIEIKNLSEQVRQSINQFFEKSTYEHNDELITVSSAMLLNLEKLIKSYQLGDLTYENVKSEMTQMLKQIDILSRKPKYDNYQTKSDNREETIYDILRVKPNFSIEELKYMRNALVKLNINNEEQLKKINFAYDILKDPDKRKKYNLDHNIEG